MKNLSRSMRLTGALVAPVFAGALLSGGAAAGQTSDSPARLAQNPAYEALLVARNDATAGVTRVPVTLTGGFDTDRRDGGRPVTLIAAALGVPAEVFRATFRNVRPAPAGQEPEPGQVHQNKEALLRGLEPYGVTNDRLDTVSNFYRYNRSRGEMWRTTPATAYATVRNGKVLAFTITNPGSGYSSPPRISVPGLPDLTATATLAFSTDFRKNGSLKAITLGGPAAPNDPSTASDDPGRDDRPRRPRQGGPGAPPPPPPPR